MDSDYDLDSFIYDEDDNGGCYYSDDDTGGWNDFAGDEIELTGVDPELDDVQYGNGADQDDADYESDDSTYVEFDGVSKGNPGPADQDDADYESDDSAYVEFDGVSKGNPGPAGGGAVIKNRDDTVVWKVHKGLGNATNNEAEYEGFKEGLKTALEMGYDRVHVKGDSKLVTNQVTDKWAVRNERMAKHYNDARELMDQFRSVDVSHHPRGQNTEADAEANKGAKLPAGEVYKHGEYYRHSWY